MQEVDIGGKSVFSPIILGNFSMEEPVSLEQIHFSVFSWVFLVYGMGSGSGDLLGLGQVKIWPPNTWHLTQLRH